MSVDFSFHTLYLVSHAVDTFPVVLLYAHNTYQPTCKGFFPQYTVTRQIFLFSQRYQFGNQRCNFVHKFNEISPQIDLQPHNHRFTINSGFNLMYCDLPANSITTHSGVANDAMAKTSAAKHKNPPTITNLSMI